MIYDAFEKMAKRNIHTLVFLYSGHHGKTGFKVGMNEYVKIKDINDSIQKCTHIKKVIAFMDCCFPEEIKVNAEQRLIQFNATSSADEVMWRKGKQSYFTNVLVQAFTMKASGKCERSGCECCIEGNFITIDKLKNYIEKHRQNGLLPQEPQKCESKIDWWNEYLAYNFSYKVAFRFEIVLPTPFTAKQAHEVLATTVVDYQGLIQRILFPMFANLLGERLNTQGKSISHTDNDADVLCIVYETGPKSCEEIDNIETLLLAWNSKRLLFCKLRFSQTSNFHKPFGFFLKNGKSVQDFIYENGKSVKDYVNEKNEFELKEMENILQELHDKQSKCDTPENALTDFILNVSSFINWCNQTKLKHRKLKIRFIDLFEECSSCVVHLLLITPVLHTDAISEVATQKVEFRKSLTRSDTDTAPGPLSTTNTSSRSDGLSLTTPNVTDTALPIERLDSRVEVDATPSHQDFSDMNERIREIETLSSKKDVLVVHSQIDLKDTSQFLEILQKVGDKNNIMPRVTGDVLCDIPGGEGTLGSVSSWHDKYRCILVFVTNAFQSDDIRKYHSETAIVWGLDIGEDKRNRVVPVWVDVSRTTCMIPFLKPITGITYPREMMTSSFEQNVLKKEYPTFEQNVLKSIKHFREMIP